VDAKKFAAMPLRPWIAPALGAGLLIAGLAMIAGLSSRYGPFVFIAVVTVILSIGHVRTKPVADPTAPTSDDARRPVGN
jgi:uncharacterized membrane protein YphA (DoxX/SURF4 family)